MVDIDRGLYAAPEGVEDMPAAADVLVDIDLDEMPGGVIEMDDGSVEITLGPAPPETVETAPFDANLAEYMEEDDLSQLASDVLAHVQSDTDSRKDWVETFVKGLDVLGFDYEERTEPWDGACGVFSTVLSEAAIRFQAETMSETFPAAGPVKIKVLGEETKEKRDAAERVKADMNYALTEQMVEYRSEHERMLYSLGLSGSAFKKVYFDPNIGRQTAVFIAAEDVLVPYGASHINMAERVTHVMRKTKGDMQKLQAAGFYRDIELGDPTPFHSDVQEKKAEEDGYTLSEDDRYCVYEVHTETVVPGVDDPEDLPKPYVVSIERGTGEVLSVRRNWNPDDDLRLKRQHFVHYTYIPGFGFYGLGLIHIIGGYAKAGTSIIRQLVDAGTLANLPGGLKTRGLRVDGDDRPIQPGEFKDVNVTSGSIKDNIMTLPYKEPSQTLLALLDRITSEGRRMGGISDIEVSDMSANAPVGTTLALLERTLKPMTAVQARVHYSMRQEFQLLKAIMAEHAPEDYTYLPYRGENAARSIDYSMADVIPVSDPNSSTMAQRVVQYQAVFQMAQSAPQIYDLPYLHRQMIEVLGIKNADKIVPSDEDAEPKDPVTENMDALMGTPMKAFIYQDHQAHIAAHTAFMQDPMIAQSIGQNPQAQQIMASLQAHIAEHMGFLYRQQIEDKLGVALPPPGDPLPEEIEVQLSRLVADAGQQLTQTHQREAAQQQAEQQAQDPNLQIKREEVQTKRMEVMRKARKDMQDAEFRAEELRRKNRSEEAKRLVEAAEQRLKEAELEVDRMELAVDAREKDVSLRQADRDADRSFQLDIARMMREGNNRTGGDRNE